METSIHAIDSRVPSVARIDDYLLGGSTHFKIDREACARVASEYPGGVAAGRANIRATRRFLGRAVRFLAGEAGVRQFLDLGSGIPTMDNVHEVAQRTAPDARVMYVDSDPVVLAHAQDMMRDGPAGATTYVYADFRDVEHLLDIAAATLDLSRPVAVTLSSVLHTIGDDDDPGGIVARLTDAIAPGSYLVMSHMSSDIAPEIAGFLARLNVMLPKPLIDRGRDQLAGFLDGLELVEPGIVPIDRWRPDGTTAAVPGGRTPPYYGAIGRKAAPIRWCRRSVSPKSIRS